MTYFTLSASLDTLGILIRFLFLLLFLQLVALYLMFFHILLKHMIFGRINQFKISNFVTRLNVLYEVMVQRIHIIGHCVLW